MAPCAQARGSGAGLHDGRPPCRPVGMCRGLARDHCVRVTNPRGVGRRREEPRGDGCRVLGQECRAHAGALLGVRPSAHEKQLKLRPR